MGPQARLEDRSDLQGRSHSALKCLLGHSTTAPASAYYH